MKANYRHNVELAIDGRHNLIPIYSHALNIPERVYDYDNSFFVVFNKRNQKYEIHSLDYPKGQTISVTIPYPELDARAIEHIRYNDIRVHGAEIFRRLEIQEQRQQRRAERERRNFARDFATEYRSEFAKSAWTM